MTVIFRIVSKTPKDELEVEYWHKNIDDKEIPDVKKQIREYHESLGHKDVKITYSIERDYDELEFI